MVQITINKQEILRCSVRMVINSVWATCASLDCFAAMDLLLLLSNEG